MGPYRGRERVPSLASEKGPKRPLFVGGKRGNAREHRLSRVPPFPGRPAVLARRCAKLAARTDRRPKPNAFGLGRLLFFSLPGNAPGACPAPGAHKPVFLSPAPSPGWVQGPGGPWFRGLGSAERSEAEGEQPLNCRPKPVLPRSGTARGVWLKKPPRVSVLPPEAHSREGKPREPSQILEFKRRKY